jgi:hypothetical protein
MNVRTIALFVAGALAAASALVPSPAKADTAITIGNLTTVPLKFDLRCQGEGGWHLFTLPAGEFKLYFGDLWHGACDSYESSIGTTAANGSETHQAARMYDQHTYVFVKTASVGYAAHDANQMIIVDNNSDRELDLNYACPNVAWKTMVVAAHGQNWLFTGSPSPCNPYSGAVREAGREDATLPTTPLPTGNIFTLTWNDDRHMWTIRSARAGANAPDASN